MIVEQGNKAGEIKQVFEGMGEGIRASKERKGLQLATRLFAAMSGNPLKPNDAKEIDFLRREFIQFNNTTTHEFQGKAESFRLPKERLVASDGSFDGAKTKELARTLSCAKIENVADVRKGTGEFYQDPTTKRIVFKDIKSPSGKNLSYDINQLINGFLASRNYIQSVHEGATEVQYPHTTSEGKITGKSLLILSSEAGQRLEKTILATIGAKELKEK